MYRAYRIPQKMTCLLRTSLRLNFFCSTLSLVTILSGSGRQKKTIAATGSTIRYTKKGIRQL